MPERSRETQIPDTKNPNTHSQNLTKFLYTLIPDLAASRTPENLFGASLLGKIQPVPQAAPVTPAS
jgi:hypothetical protein